MKKNFFFLLFFMIAINLTASGNKGEYTLDLKEGWSMQSIPVDIVLRPDLTNYNFTNKMNEFSDIYVGGSVNFKIFGNYKIIWQYIDGKWQGYSEDISMQNSIISHGYDLITQIDKKNSFWILMGEDRLVTFFGKKYATPFENYKPNNWYLIRYKGHMTKNEKRLMGISTTWQYVDGKWMKDAQNFHGTTWIKRDSSVLSEAAKLYLEGRNAYYDEDYTKAKEKYEDAESLGLDLARLSLGWMYFDGKGVTKDYQTAKSYFEDSTDSVYSKYALGYMYQGGYGVEKNYAFAKQYYDESIVDSNYSGSFNNLGTMYEFGEGVAKDYSKAIRYYTQAIDMQNSTSLHNLGRMYEEGKGVAKNIDKAFELYTQSAFHNNKFGQYDIGYAYYDGTCVHQDYTKAKRWFEKSAFFGEYARAYNMLGIMYRNGKGVVKDYSKAIEYYTKAMNIDVSNTATSNLGNMYKNGYGVSQDYSRAAELYQLSANHGNKYGQGNLANMYVYGKGVSQNYNKAFEYYKLAANQGLNWAQRSIGYMYYRGDGVKQDYNKAFDWFKKAADNDDISAMSWLGNYYLYGYGSITKNYTKSYEWYIKAAANGNSHAQNQIGYIYFEGLLSTSNKTKAYCWFLKAADSGNDTSKEWIDNSSNWNDINIPSDCSVYLKDDINTYKITEEPNSKQPF